ncbi:hypothetical protein B0T22DRAFT_483500 [Podospora appendiculata]|uniref:Uncharacterized protein n=1 Tax=Podospora appendiculata TaxID=314037 RepID=A0AAE0X2Z0_9PEZI|nr:hypothetical protein B0T22DRAFT_483500 [Podospora appendiculata]
MAQRNEAPITARAEHLNSLLLLQYSMRTKTTDSNFNAILSAAEDAVIEAHYGTDGNACIKAFFDFDKPLAAGSDRKIKEKLNQARKEDVYPVSEYPVSEAAIRDSHALLCGRDMRKLDGDCGSRAIYLRVSDGKSPTFDRTKGELRHTIWSIRTVVKAMDKGMANLAETVDRMDNGIDEVRVISDAEIQMAEFEVELDFVTVDVKDMRDGLRAIADIIDPSEYPEVAKLLRGFQNYVDKILQVIE